jgi:NADH dehydrogenase FAD-containing subunit
MRVLVLGAGFGGLELTTRLSEEFGDDVEVVLIDQADGFVLVSPSSTSCLGVPEPKWCTTRTVTW